MLFKSPLKCPGGKRRLLSELTHSFPPDFSLKKYTYIEPFLGGGALLLKLLENEPKLNNKIIANDANIHIMNLWKSIKYDVEGVIYNFNKLIEGKKLNKELFDSIKSNLMGLKEKPFVTALEHTTCCSSEQAAIFLFLNKNCYNGSIRFNKLGKFNAPLGLYNKIQGFDIDNFKKLNKILDKVKLENIDFEELIKKLQTAARKWENVLIYFDPPYAPLSSTSHFTYYTAGGFTTFDQYRLKGTIDFLTSLGTKIILSNSNSDLILYLYKNYNIREIKAPRVINIRGAKRGNIKELIITNY